MKKVTVLISQYNSGQWIQQRINNLLESTIINDLEIICINANSPDPLDDIIPQQYKQIKYIKHPTRIGIYEAWNLGIQESTSPYIANANTDDLVSPNCYETLANILDNQPNIDVAYCNWYSYTPSSKVTCWKDIKSKKKLKKTELGLYLGDFTRGRPSHFPMWKRNLHNKIGLFTDKLPALGDAEFWARAYFKANANFYWVREELGAYQWRNGDNAWYQYMTDDQWPCLYKIIEEYKNESDRKIIINTDQTADSKEIKLAKIRRKIVRNKNIMTTEISSQLKLAKKLRKAEKRKRLANEKSNSSDKPI